MKQIVISVPEEWLKGTQPNLYDVMGAVMSGTVLPEHHGRLIDADAFSDEDNTDKWHTVFNDDTGCYENVVLLDDIKSAPTIIPATKEGDGDE